MDLEALTTMIWLLLRQWKELQFIIWNPQNCLEFEGNLNARSASAISSARIPSECYADFSLWTLVVTLRLFFLYFAKTFEYLKERRSAAGHVGTKGGVGWSDSPLPWKVSWSLFISLCFSVNVTAWFNNQAYHAIAVSLAAADAGILRSVLGKNVSMTTVNHPLPRTAQESINDLQR